MKLLNVGAGGCRPQDEHWWNTDNLQEQLAIGTPERANLDAEPRYAECDLLMQSLPFPDECFDGLCLSHVLEHFTCHDAVNVLIKCRRVLKTGGLLVASVPNADYFLKVYHHDKPERAVELFGEPINLKEANTFFDYGLFFRFHRQVLTEGALRCLLIRSGFWIGDIELLKDYIHYADGASPLPPIEAILSRRKFSLEMVAVKAPTTAPPATAGASSP